MPLYTAFLEGWSDHVYCKRIEVERLTCNALEYKPIA